MQRNYILGLLLSNALQLIISARTEQCEESSSCSQSIGILVSISTSIIHFHGNWTVWGSNHINTYQGN